MASEMIYPDGKREPVVPENGRFWTLRELQAKVGGFIEVTHTHDGKWMVVNEDGKKLQLAPNRVATELYIFGEADIIVGNVVIVDSMAEFNEPGDDEKEGWDE